MGPSFHASRVPPSQGAKRKATCIENVINRAGIGAALMLCGYQGKLVRNTPLSEDYASWKPVDATVRVQGLIAVPRDLLDAKFYAFTQRQLMEAPAAGGQGTPELGCREFLC